MAAVVRSSKFRHVFGKTVRKEDQYENVQVGIRTPPYAARTPPARMPPCARPQPRACLAAAALACARVLVRMLADPRCACSPYSAMPRRQTPTWSMPTPSTSACRGAAAAGPSWCGPSTRRAACPSKCRSAQATAAQSWTCTSTRLLTSASRRRPMTQPVCLPLHLRELAACCREVRAPFGNRWVGGGASGS